MQLVAGLVCYLLAMTALVGGGMAAFVLFLAEPAGSRAAPAPATARQASVPPNIAAFLERKAERPLTPAKTSEPAQPVTPAAAEPSRPAEQARRDDGAGQQRQTRKKKQRAIGRRAPASGSEFALGYAPAPSRPAYAASIFHRTDRMGD